MSAERFYETRARGPLDLFHRLFSVFVVFWLLWLGYDMLIVLGQGVPSTCLVAAPYLPNWGLATIGVVALLVGRNWNRLRKHVDHDDDNRGSQVAGQLAMLFLFFALAVVWFFEALGTARVLSDANLGLHFQPITYYVRCAIFQDFASKDNGVLTGKLIATMGFLAGHWLWSWHPTLRKSHSTQNEEAPLS